MVTSRKMFMLACAAVVAAAAGCSIRVPVHRGDMPALTDKQADKLVEDVLASVRGKDSKNPFAIFSRKKTEERLAAERHQLLLRLAQDKGDPAKRAVKKLLAANIAALNAEIMEALLKVRTSAYAAVLLEELPGLDKDRLLVRIDVAYKLNPETSRLKLIEFIADEEPDGQLRLAAVRTVSAFFDAPDAVEVMIGSLARCHEKTVRRELFDKLQDVTGADMGDNVADWQRWWRANRSVDPPRWLRDKIAELRTLLTSQEDQHTSSVAKMTEIVRDLLSRVPPEGKGEVLAKALDADVPEVRALAAREAGRLKLTSVREQLTVLTEDQQEAVRRESVWALGEMQAIEARRKVAKALRQDAAPAVRAAAAEALGKLGDKQSVSNLLEALRDEDATVRDNVAASLRKFQAIEAAPIIREMLGQERFEENREEFLKALGAFADKASTEVVMKLLWGSDCDESEEIRVAAADALGKIGDERAVKVLMAAMWGDQHDPSVSVRFAAADALGKISDERAVDVLGEAMGDSDQRMREAAVTALGRIGTEKALNALLEKLLQASEEQAPAIWKSFKAGALGDPGSVLKWADELSRRKLDARSTELLEELVRRADSAGADSHAVLRGGALAADRLGKEDVFRRLAEAALAKTGNDPALWRVYVAGFVQAKEYETAWDAYDRYAAAVKDALKEAAEGQAAVIEALLAAGQTDQAAALYERLPREHLDEATRRRLSDAFSGEEETADSN